MEDAEKDKVAESEPAKEFVEFKKPIFIGKIGRLPRKLVKPESQESPNVGSSSADTTNKNETSSGTIKERAKVKSELPPALLLKEKSIPLPYKEPKWSGLPPPESGYCFEVLKSGSILGTVDLTKKAFHVFGRLCQNDIVMAHPTISRHHAVMQYKARVTEDQRPCGFYLYDLGSSHGTFVNKARIKPNHYARVMVGHLIKLGCSTRQFILQGPQDDAEQESELSLTEMKQLRLARKLEQLKERQAAGGKEEKDEDTGISWGIADDAEEEPDLADNPFAVASNEELYLEDPKKTLRGYLEREGYPLEYDCQERGIGQFVCRVELPIEDMQGRPIVAEIIHKGKKKDAVVQCALEACRIIDRHGLLRQAKHESRKRKNKDWKDDDYYDSDEDTFLDRTGDVENKREVRMRGGDVSAQPQVLTYPQLLAKCEEIVKQVKEMESRLSVLRGSEEDTDEDALDQFMKGLGKQSISDKAEISKAKLEIRKLKVDLAKTQRLAEIAKPADLPALIPQVLPDTTKTPIVKKASSSVIIGKRIKLKSREKTPYKMPNTSSSQEGAFVEEKDSDEESEKDDNLINNDRCVDRLCLDGSESMDVKDSSADNRQNSLNNRQIDDGSLSVELGKSNDVNLKNDESKKTYGPMRPPSGYVIPDDYYNEGTDRDLPEMTDETN